MGMEENVTDIPAAPQPSFEKPGKLQGWLQTVKNYINECIRVLKVTKKPTMFEFKTVVKVSALGLLLIGFIGFVIFLIGKIFR